MFLSPHLRFALSVASDDQLVYDVTGIEERYDSLLRELPGARVRFAIKACPVHEVLVALASRGAGFDAASPNEIAHALRTGVPVGRIHYGNTIKSDGSIVEAYRRGVRDFATDSVEDVRAVATHAPGARVFCRLAASGEGALWGLSDKCGCPVTDAVRVMETAADSGLTPSGLSIHVGSQQMTVAAWRAAFCDLVDALAALDRSGITVDHVNLGGGLPALGYLDQRGTPLRPPMDEIFGAIRTGMRRLRQASRAHLDFILEPGRHLVADHGAIRAHVCRLSARRRLTGERQHWLYLSCGKFNGLYEMDQVQYPLVFPSHRGGECVSAVVAGPTCDSDDAFGHEDNLVPVPKAVASGDPVWILSSGAYAASYTTVGFNGFDPLPHKTIRGAPGRSYRRPGLIGSGHAGGKAG
jgi:ornithine decarboxylase